MPPLEPPAVPEVAGKVIEIGVGDNARVAARIIEIRVTADGFLRYMVRIIAGTLVSSMARTVSAGIWAI